MITKLHGAFVFGTWCTLACASARTDNTGAGEHTSTVSASARFLEPLPTLPPLDAKDLESVEGNGELVSLPIKGTDQVAIRILFYSGSSDDPQGKEGLTQLSARLLAEGGSRTLSYPQLLAKLYPMATEIHAAVDKEQTVFSALVHKERVHDFAPLLANVLTEPRLDEKDFVRLRDDQKNDLEKRLCATDDENLGKAVANAMLYPNGHPYHHPVIGTSAGLSSITLDDVKQHVRAVFGKRRMLIGIAGAVDEGVEAALFKHLQRLGEGAPRLASIPVAPRVDENEVWIVKKSAKAVAISLVHPHASRRGHPDFPALGVVQSYFGEHRQFQGVLMQAMREKRGLNYGDYAYVENFIQAGWTRDVRTNIARRRQHFEMWIRPVDPKDTLFALRLALYLRDDLVRDGLTEEELRNTREFLLGYTRLWDVTPMRRLGYLLDDDFYQFAEHLEAFRARMKTLTRDEIHDAIKRNLASPGLKIAIVAQDAEALKAALLAGAPSTKQYPSTVTPDVQEMDKIFASFPLRLTERQIQIVTAEEVFAK